MSNKVKYILLLTLASCGSFRQTSENIGGSVHLCNDARLGKGLFVSYKRCMNLELPVDDVQEGSINYVGTF